MTMNVKTPEFFPLQEKTDFSLSFLIMKRPLFFILIILCFGGCSHSRFTNNNGNTAEAPEYITKSDFLLNTVVSIQLYDKQEEALIEGCFDLISKYEAIYSRTSETSELYALNYGNAPLLSHSGSGYTYSVSNELYDILSKAFYYSKLSGGGFDLSVAPITSLWDFKSSPPSLPKKEAINQALEYVGYEKLRLAPGEVTFAKSGIGIDLGAIAKGYIADRVKEYLLANGVKSAVINLGGNILCVGEKPDGSAFHIGIQKPYADRNETVAVMDIRDLSVVSSGVYERYFELDGVSYHHILDPKTGYPYQNGLVSVTIISKESADGDGLSTSCFALGLEKGLQLIESLPDTYAIFITSDYQLHYSRGFTSSITITR